MKITQLLSIDSIDLNAKPKDKAESVDLLVELISKTGNLTDKGKFKQAVLKREQLGTTGIGGFIAIPHGKSDAVKTTSLSAMVVKDGVDYESMDGDVTKLFFLIGVSDSSDNEHLHVLSSLSTMLMDDDFKNKLIDAKTPEEFLKIIDEKEKEVSEEESDNVPGCEILAVTACPTGIAHTYMAAESLQNTAKNMGHSIKVETNGSAGVENKLTPDDIKNAKAIIVAADTNVDMDRFDGKKVVIVGVSDAIKDPKGLINKAMGDSVQVFRSKKDAKDMASEENKDSKGSTGKQIYKHLMNGVTYMLPFVIGGGILIAIAFLLDDYTIDPSNYGSNTPLAAMFKNIGGTAFSFMLPVLAGFIALSIGDRPALAVGFVGGALASSGGSGFLGALVAGFCAGYIILLIRKLTDKLPKSLEGIKPVLIFPVAGILIMGIIMQALINPFVGVLNTAMTNGLNSIQGSGKMFLGFLLGAMMATDMGGPINKAAYVFGTASLANGSSQIMAAVMAGGMIPPLAIALATVFFKNRFTEKERKSGPTNFIMGISFITEGAIPFAAADPTRVIPSCIISSGVAGALSMMFNCSLRAPHGGLWVIGVIENPVGYLIALIIGSLVGMLLLGVLKKKVEE